MVSLTEVERIMVACTNNAEELLNVAKEVAKKNTNHIAYHLSVLALEEIGKSAMILMSSLGSPREEERKRPSDWIDDHERKLFWALWSPRIDKEAPWQGIQQATDLARQIHETRLATLYVDPKDLDARTRITSTELQALLNLTEAHLGMERAKKLRDLTDEQKSDLDWFFFATDDPQLRPMIFSKGSLEKQAEFEKEPGGWIHWLRATIEEWRRESQALTQMELNRVPPEGDEGYEDKWEIKIRLKSWSHSIRPKPLNQWNENVDKIKLFPTKDKSELLVKFIAPKKLQGQMVWEGGMQSAYLLVIALNIGTAGFFWWYLPTFISRYAESVVDLEQNADVVFERVPQLKISWGHLALQSEDLSQVGVVFAHLATLHEEREQAPYKRYFRALALLAKNDIFFQFEPNLLGEFAFALKDAMAVYGDWDGKDERFDEAIGTAFQQLNVGTEFIAMVKDLEQVAALTSRGLNKTRPITLEDVAKMKVSCDTYLRLKAAQAMRDQIQAAKLSKGSTQAQM
jgi:AbiV family abortive infection protein